MIRSNSRKLLLALLLVSTQMISQSSAQSPMANPVSQLVLPADIHSFPFTWRGDSILGRWEAYAVMLVPVSLPGIRQKFYMQFDLGANVSMFYGPALQGIAARYPQVVKEIGGKLEDVSFSIGTMPVLAKEITVKQFGSGTINWTDQNAYNIIGTIGADLCDGRFLLIDYPGHKLSTGNNVPSDITKEMELDQLVYAGGKILLPAYLRGKKQLLYFDTGSSAFAFMTDKSTSELLSLPGQAATTFTVNSWGKLLTAHTLPTGDSILIAAQKIPLHKTTYVDGVNDNVVQQMQRVGITGLTGNKLFIGSVLLIDLKNKRFGIRK